MNLSEDQNTMISNMRRVITEDLDSEEAVKSYHDDLSKINLKPDRDLEADMEITDPALKM